MTGKGILLVSSQEDVILALLHSLEQNAYNLFPVMSGQEALALLSHQPVQLMVVDAGLDDMPAARLLDESRRRCPGAITFLLVQPEEAMAAAAFQWFHQLVVKPWDDAELQVRVREALFQQEVLKENRRLSKALRQQNKELTQIRSNLERQLAQKAWDLSHKEEELRTLRYDLNREYHESARILTTVIDLRDAILGGHCRRVARAAYEIATAMKLPLEEVQRIEVAASLHDIGKLGIAEEVLHKRGDGLNKWEQRLLNQHAVMGETVLLSAERLADGARLVRHHHERFDGKGYPDGLRGEAIPIGSRIIAVADALENSLREAEEPAEALQRILAELSRGQGSLYDPLVVRCVADVLRRLDVSFIAPQERWVMAEELVEGMLLSRDLYTSQGILLLPRDEPLTWPAIEKIYHYQTLNQLVGGIYVYVSTRAAASARKASLRKAS